MEVTITNKAFVPPNVEKGEEAGYLIVWYSISADWGGTSSNVRLDVPEKTPDAEIEQAIRAKYKAATTGQDQPVTTKPKGKK